MKVLNIIWKFTTGGIGKCFLIYDKCSNVDNDVKVISTCVDPINCEYDRKPLYDINARILKIKNRKDFSWIGKIYNLIINEKPDIIFTHGLYGAIIIEVTKFFHPKIKNIPVVISFHGLYNPPTWKTAILTSFFNKLIAFICKYRATKVVIVSKFAGEYLLKNGVSPDKLHLVYNGLKEHIESKSPVVLDKSFVNIGFAGRIDEIKGIKYLLEAIASLKKEINTKIKLYIIGNGPLLNEMIFLSRTLDITDIVEFKGYQNNIADWLNSLDIFVLPSLQENHSIALLEAMRAGCAIVCTNIGGNPETVNNEREALLVPSKDSMAIKKAMKRLIESEELRTYLGNNAKLRFLNTFTEEKTKRSLVICFKSILGDSRK